MGVFRKICAELGVTLAEDKTLGPANCLVYLGLEINTFSMTVKIPLDKIQQLKFKLLHILQKRNVTLLELQELTGLLNFCIRAIPAGKAFVRRLYDASCGLSRPYHRRRVTEDMRRDIDTWLMFLENFNGVTSYRLVNWSMQMILISSYIQILQVMLIKDAGQFSVIIGHTWVGRTIGRHWISSQT